MAVETFIPGNYYNNEITAGGFTAFGGGNFGDSSDASGGTAYENIDYSFGWDIIDNSRIPTTASIVAVTVRTRLAADNGVMAPRHYVRTSSTNNISSNAEVPTTYPTYTICDESFSLDGTSSAWTRASLFTSHYGIYLPAIGAPPRFLNMVEVRTLVDFTLAAPSVTTVAATEVTAAQARLNAIINPNGANATYPCTFSWLWGLTSDPTTPLAGYFLTEGGDTGVSAVLSSLSPSTTYYFRAKAVNDSNTVLGSVLSFTTSPVDIACGRF